MAPSISRRDALTAFGAVGIGALVAACTGNRGSDEPAASETTSTIGFGSESPTELVPDLFDDASTCSLAPEQTEGPFYLDVDSIRRDIRDGREGLNLRLGVRVRDAERCVPIDQAVVDVWHCDALGAYSSFQSASVGGGSDADPRFLRGSQVTNADGIAEFLTVFPGWYEGRTVHVHAKVHLDNATVLTSQLYFPDDVGAAVFEREPYAQHAGARTLNHEDGIFDERLLMTIVPEGDGYLGLETFDVARS